MDEQFENVISPRLAPDRRRVTWIVIVGLLLLTIALACMVALKRNQAIASAKNAGMSPLVGTWRNGEQSVLNLRADGTGRHRWNLESSEFGYFEWEVAGGQLRIRLFSKPPSWRLRAMLLFQNYGDQFEIVEKSDSVLLLHDSTSGNEIRLERCSDPELEAQ